MEAKDENWAYFLEANDYDTQEGMDAFEATKLLHTPWENQFYITENTKHKGFFFVFFKQ